MAEQGGQPRWIVKVAYAAFLSTLGLLALAMAAVVALTVRELLTEWSWEVLIRGVFRTLAVLLGGLWAAVAYGLVGVFDSAEKALRQSLGRLGRAETLLQDQCKSLRELVALGQMSDQAKSLVFRQRDLEAFRDAFHDMLVRQQYDVAESLIRSAQERAGYEAEVLRMRSELAESRKATQAEKINAAVARIDRIIAREDWARALSAAQELLGMFPENSTLAALPERIQAAKVKHKRELLQAYGEAIRKNDIDNGIELLKELDQYLTPQEAAALEESARGVFRAKLHNLGVQFALCVTDERWAQAVQVGQQIVKEYPNSRMAHEVSEKMDLLRSRASAQAQQRA